MNRKKAYLKLILLIGIIVIIPIVLFITCQNTLFNKEWLSNLANLINKNPQNSAIVLLGLQIMQIIICIIPGQPIQFAASYIFGTVGGYLVSICGAVIGSIFVFYIAKFLGAESIRTIFGQEKVDNYRNKINTPRGLTIVFLLYLIPGLPKDVIAYIAGISEMPILPFIIVSSIGRTPPMLGSLLTGAYLQQRNWTAIAVLAVICLIILAVCWWKRKEIIRLIDNLENKDNERRARHGKEQS